MVEQFCGCSGVWTQMSAYKHIETGGRIHVSGLLEAQATRVLGTLQKHSQEHPIWDPVRRDGEYILLGKEPHKNPNILYWRDATVYHPVTGEILLDHLMSTTCPSITANNSHDKTYFYYN